MKGSSGILCIDFKDFIFQLMYCSEGLLLLKSFNLVVNAIVVFELLECSRGGI